MPAGPRPAPPTRVVRYTHGGTYAGGPWSCGGWLFLTGSGEIEHDTLVNLADGVFGAFSSFFSPRLSSVLIIDRAQVVLYADGGPFEAVTTSAAVPGSVSGGALPANCACCISWKIGRHYRGGHPRMYLPGLPLSSISGAYTFDSTFLGDIASAATAYHDFLEALTPGDGVTSVEHGAVSFVDDGAWRTPPLFQRINDVRVDSRIDTQRRRLGRDRP